MKQEDKELLIQELSMRLPYGVICRGTIGRLSTNWTVCGIRLDDEKIFCRDKNEYRLTVSVENCKPYLIPISEMSDYEIEELYKAFGFGYMVNNFKLTEEWEKFQDLIKDGDIFIPYPIWIKDFQNGIKFLLKNHFDYQGLIPKGLAIAVTKENNPYNITEE